jgi:hypothetical protein
LRNLDTLRTCKLQQRCERTRSLQRAQRNAVCVTGREKKHQKATENFDTRNGGPLVRELVGDCGNVDAVGVKAIGERLTHRFVESMVDRHTENEKDGRKHKTGQHDEQHISADGAPLNHFKHERGQANHGDRGVNCDVELSLWNECKRGTNAISEREGKRECDR